MLILSSVSPVPTSPLINKSGHFLQIPTIYSIAAVLICHFPELYLFSRLIQNNSSLSPVAIVAYFESGLNYVKYFYIFFCERIKFQLFILADKLVRRPAQRVTEHGTC